MKKSDMVCAVCVYRSGNNCFLDPLPLYIGDEMSEHWCGRGKWREYSNVFKDCTLIDWGDWETEEESDNGQGDPP